MTVTRFLAKRSAAAVLAVALALLGPAVASAHPRFERSEPAAGAHLDRIPTELRLVFSAAIERAFTRLQLLGPDSTEVPLGEIRLDSAHVVTAAIRGALRAGTYTVVWQVAGADGHPIRGRYAFTIAPGAAGVADVPAAEPPRGEPAGAITAPGRTPAQEYAKTVVAVGCGGARAFSIRAGHPLEFVPGRDPATLVAGDTTAILLLYRGQPLAGVTVHAGAVHRRRRPGMTRTGSSEALPDSIVAPDVHLTTDATGVLRLPITAGGLWNARTIHVVQADQGPGADWDTHWATLVFEAGERGNGDERSGASTANAPRSDSSDVANVVARYHEALATGDSATALALLAPDAIILESGDLETREEYRLHHLPADIQFARAVRSERSPLRVTIHGDVAWVSSTSTTQGNYRERAVNSAGAELMVLTREADGWRIRAIHWSSRTRRPPG